MDWLTFVAELVKATAWPVGLFAAVLLLRRPLTGLIPLLQKFKYKDLELEFGRRLQEAKEEAAEELPPGQQPAPRAAIPNRILELARISPRAAVIEAWREVESALLEAARRNDVPLSPADTASPLRTVRALERSKVLDPSRMGIFHDLRALRNQAVHAPEFAVSTDAALEYADLAARLAEYIRSASRAD